MLPKSDIVQALWKANGSLSLAADILGVPYSKLHTRIRSSNELQRVLADVREYVIDKAEARLFDAAINEGKAWALKFLLERQARHRGYGAEVAVRHEGSVEVTIQWPLD